MSEKAWAQLSDDKVYRYLLGRRWSREGLRDTWVMLNPSTADAVLDDPTIKRCRNFSRDRGAGVMIVVNLFALRATDPTALYHHPDPVGPSNDAVINWVARYSDRIICAWGAHPEAQRRVEEVLRLLPTDVPLLTLGLTKGGAPRHPLYVPGATEFTPLERAA